MKVFSVTGLSGSGKTTTIENIIKELISRGHSVGSVKEIHFEQFAIDTEGKNTYRHRMAGSSLVTALASGETDIMYQGKLNIYDVLAHYTQDFVVLEGVKSAVVPNIAVAKAGEVPKVSPLTFAVSGCFANDKSGEEYVVTAQNLYKYDTSALLGDTNLGTYTLPIINGVDETAKLVDLIESVTPELMPDIDPDCCKACGVDCRQYLAKCLRGEERAECALHSKKVSVKIDGKDVFLVPFVEKIVRNSALSVVKELKGYRAGSKIEIEFLGE